MSEAEVVGEKRKASPVSEEEHRLQQYSDEVQAQLNELELEKKSILDGTSLSFAQRQRVLAAARDEAIARADSYREWQIAAVEALFEYEKAESESLYRSGLEEAKQNMIKQLEQQMQELKDSEEPDNMKSNVVENRPTTRSQRTRLKSSKKKDERSESEEPGAATAAATAAAAGAPIAQAPEPRIVQSLQEGDIFNDIKSVYQDWTRRASEFQVLTKSFLMPAKIDKGKFYYREHMFAVGDKVSVWSTLTKKRFSGVIAALAPTEVVLRLPDHSLARIALTHIRHGRCVFSPIEAAP